jgi:hypothetical protein
MPKNAMKAWGVIALDARVRVFTVLNYFNYLHKHLLIAPKFRRIIQHIGQAQC